MAKRPIVHLGRHLRLSASGALARIEHADGDANLDIDSLLDALVDSGGVRHLVLDRHMAVPSHLHRLHTLRSLDLREPPVDLPSTLLRLPELERLSASGGLGYVSTALDRHPGLKHLSLGGGGIAPLGTVPRLVRRLEGLRATLAPLDPIEDLTRMRALRDVGLTLRRDQLDPVLRCLAGIPRLQRVELRSAASGEAWGCVPDAIGRLAPVRHLVLAIPVAALPDTIAALVGLAELNLGGSRVVDIGDLPVLIPGLQRVVLPADAVGGWPGWTWSVGPGGAQHGSR